MNIVIRTTGSNISLARPCTLAKGAMTMGADVTVPGEVFALLGFEPIFSGWYFDSVEELALYETWASETRKQYVVKDGFVPVKGAFELPIGVVVVHGPSFTGKSVMVAWMLAQSENLSRFTYKLPSGVMCTSITFVEHEYAFGISDERLLIKMIANFLTDQDKSQVLIINSLRMFAFMSIKGGAGIQGLNQGLFNSMQIWGCEAARLGKSIVIIFNTQSAKPEVNEEIAMSLPGAVSTVVIPTSVGNYRYTTRIEDVPFSRRSGVLMIPDKELPWKLPDEPIDTPNPGDDDTLFEIPETAPFFKSPIVDRKPAIIGGISY